MLGKLHLPVGQLHRRGDQVRPCDRQHLLSCPLLLPQAVAATFPQKSQAEPRMTCMKQLPLPGNGKPVGTSPGVLWSSLEARPCIPAPVDAISTETPKPPQVLLGSVQDAARSALSNGTGQASSQQGFT